MLKSGQAKVASDTSRSSRWAASEPPSSEDLDPYPGTDAPTTATPLFVKSRITADRLHPRVWTAASAIWDTGEYRVAVARAALSLSMHIKARAESKLADGKLVSEVLSPDPPKIGATRLQFPGDKDDETWRSRQRGLHMLAQGAYAGIRNVSAHEDEPLEEHAALEYLAVFSVIARWVDETEPMQG